MLHAPSPSPRIWTPPLPAVLRLPRLAMPGGITLLGAGRRRAAGGGGLIDPATLSPYFWWELSSTADNFEDTGLTDTAETNDLIASFNDKGSANSDGLQATSGNRPVLRADGALRYAEFDGTDDIIAAGAGASTVFQNKAGFTIVAGVYIVAAGAGAKTIMSFLTGTGNTKVSLQVEAGTTNLTFNVRRTSGDSSTQVLRSISTGAAFVITAHCDYASTGNISLAINRGTAATATLPGTPANSQSTAAGSGFGGFGGTSANPLNGRIYSLLVTPLLSGADTTSLEAYVASKAGVTL